MLAKKLTLGCATELAFAELVKKAIATSVETEVFKTEYLTFFIATTQKMFECSPLGSTIFRYASSLNPPYLNHPSTPALLNP